MKDEDDGSEITGFCFCPETWKKLQEKFLLWLPRYPQEPLLIKNLPQKQYVLPQQQIWRKKYLKEH